MIKAVPFVLKADIIWGASVGLLERLRNVSSE